MRSIADGSIHHKCTTPTVHFVLHAEAYYNSMLAFHTRSAAVDKLSNNPSD